MTPNIQSSVTQNFVAALSILAQGMAGIFLFMAVFYGLIYGLEKLFKDKKEQ